MFFIVLYTVTAVGDDQPAGGMTTRSGTLTSLYSPEQAKALSKTLPIDEPVQWQVYVPGHDKPGGILVFISPSPSAAPQPDWIDVLDKMNLIWVAAEQFGNSKPTAKRILTALMGLTMAQRSFQVDNGRIYVAGMSGGGRVASKVVTLFPRLFTGAMYFVGVDFWTPAEKPLLEHIAGNRYVFLTGHNDFNRREIIRTYKKYKRAGVNQIVLMDLPEFGHEYPDAEQFAQAVRFLDTGLQPAQ